MAARTIEFAIVATGLILLTAMSAGASERAPERAAFLQGPLAAPPANPAPESLAGTPEAQRWLVGFEILPSHLSVGGELGGSRVLLVNPTLKFAVLESSTRPALDPSLGIRYVERDSGYGLLFDRADPLASQQYGPQLVAAPEAWQRSLGTQERNVCVVDTGVRYTHEDLIDRVVLPGRNFVSTYAGAGENAWDDNGHGTHVTGIVAATIDNGKGVAGLANVNVIPMRIGGRDSGDNSVSLSAGVNAIQWCADNGGDIVTMSWGGPAFSQALADAVSYAWERGVLLVAATGNVGCSGADCIYYPAKLPEVVAVRSVNSGRAPAGLTGPELDLVAPGVNVLSTCFGSDSQYCSKTGTSMAAPHVAGVAALVWSTYPQLSNEQLRTLLRSTADDLGDPGWDVTFGHGLVNAAAGLSGAALTVAGDPTQPVCGFHGTPLGHALGGSAPIGVRSLQETASVKNVKLYVDGTPAGPPAALEASEEDPAFFSGVLETTEYPDGPHSLTAICKGSSGQAFQLERTFLISNTPGPTVEVLHPSDGDLVVGAGNVTVEIQADVDPDLDGRVEISVNGEPWVDITGTRSGDRFFFTWDPFFARDESNLRARARVEGKTAYDHVDFTVAGLNLAVETTILAAFNVERCALDRATGGPSAGLGSCDPRRWV